MATKIEVKSVSDELAESIRNIDDAMKQIAKSGLKQQTIIVLIKDMLGQRIKKQDIQDVLWALNHLKSTYLEKDSK